MKNNPIAKIIIDQILCLDKSALMVWGAHDYIICDSDNTQEGGIIFTVNGLKFKGQVDIRLQWNDSHFIHQKPMKLRFIKNSYRFEKSSPVELLFC